MSLRNSNCIQFKLETRHVFKFSPSFKPYDFVDLASPQKSLSHFFNLFSFSSFNFFPLGAMKRQQTVVSKKLDKSCSVLDLFLHDYSPLKLGFRVLSGFCLPARCAQYRPLIPALETASFTVCSSSHLPKSFEVTAQHSRYRSFTRRAKKIFGTDYLVQKEIRLSQKF